jgi:hypothetical protein
MALAWPLSAPSVDSTVTTAVPARAATSVVPPHQAGSVTVMTYPPSANRGLAFSLTVARLPVCGSVYHGQAVATAPSFRMTAREVVPR